MDEPRWQGRSVGPMTPLPLGVYLRGERAGLRSRNYLVFAWAPTELPEHSELLFDQVPWNLTRFMVSSLSMRAPLRCLLGFLVLLPSMASSQPARGQTNLPRTGFEVFLHGSTEALIGRSYRLRGRAYEVIGLADLRALPRARVRARYTSEDDDIQPGPWRSVEADTRGMFVVEVPIPAGARGVSRVELRVGQGDDSRLFRLPIELQSPIEVDLRTDRLLYEPGEPVHVWVRLWDTESLVPLADTPVEAAVSFSESESSHDLVTSAAGVASFSIDLPETATMGRRAVSVTAGRGLGTITESTSFRVGRRAVDRLAAGLELSPSAVAPEETVTARVEVRTPSGAPVRGAQVRLVINNRERLVSFETNSSGVGTTTFQAPAYLDTDTSTVSISGTVSHPAHGSIDVSANLTIARPTALRVDFVVPHGGLIPEIDDEIFISVLDAAGEAPQAGTMVEVSGHAVRGGRVRRAIDRHGFVTIPTRTPANAVAVHQGSEDEHNGLAATSIEVVVEGPLPRTARLRLPVDTNALVAPFVTQHVVFPGTSIEVRVARRPTVARRPVVVDLLDDSGTMVHTTIAAPGTARVVFTAPRDRLGLFSVRTRPVLAEGAAEGAGAEEALIIRPAHPSFVRLQADRDVYHIREDVRITVHTEPAAGPGWVALLVRDLSMHGGERPFGYRFLRGAFDRAVLDPSTPEADRLVRAALAARVTTDPLPALSPPLVDELGAPIYDELDTSAAVDRGDLRDPVARADELRRRGVTSIMTAIEQALSDALEEGRVEELTEGEGARRRFRSDIVRTVSTGLPPQTLGGGEITMEMLTAADPSFTFEAVATRVARRRLVRLMGVLASYLDPADTGEDRARGAASEPPERWLSRLVQQGLLPPSALHDPWGQTFVLRRTGRRPTVAIAVEAAGLELLSPGPDGVVGNGDDVRDPFARVVPAATPYALASGEDELMMALSLLRPGEGALSALLEAYRRLSDEALEEALGDVAMASMSEEALNALLGGALGLGSLGTIGHGGGGGSGSGYGRGAGGLRGRRATVPSISGGGRGALSAIIRERFPATLRFVPEAALAASGQTIIELELADAITTYIVEAIVWTGEGWVWSGSTTVRVDQDLVVDAPVPAVATVGDRLTLPLRVATRTKAPQRVRLRAEGSKQLALAPILTDEILVPGADAREVPVEITFAKRGEGTITVSAQAPDGNGLDATRRPVKIVDDARHVRDELEAIVDGRGELSFEVPAEALERRGSEFSLAIGPALFSAGTGGQHLAWDAWVAAFAGHAPNSSRAVAAALLELPRSEEEMGRADSIARAIGALWRRDEASDERIAISLIDVTESLSESPPDTYEQLMSEAELLLLISPALRHGSERPEQVDDLTELGLRLRRRIEESASFFSDAPWLWAHAAAALLWSRSADDTGERAVELLRRIRRSVIEVGDDLWLEGGLEDQGERLIQATALLALCEVRIGQRQQAFRFVRTAARLASADGGSMLEARALDTRGWALARVAADTMMQGQPATNVIVRIDGVEREVELVRGAATVEVAELGRPGQHRVEINAPAGAVALLRLRAEYGLPWSIRPPPADRGPLALSIEGETGALDERADLRLVVRNVVPRLVATPIVELDLPAGAELDVHARERIEAQTANTPDFSGRTLSLTLRPLCPGAQVLVELPLRWSAAGRLRGLGAVGYAADRPGAVSILPSREVTIPDARQGQQQTQGGQP